MPGSIRLRLKPPVSRKRIHLDGLRNRGIGNRGQSPFRSAKKKGSGVFVREPSGPAREYEYYCPKALRSTSDRSASLSLFYVVDSVQMQQASSERPPEAAGSRPASEEGKLELTAANTAGSAVAEGIPEGFRFAPWMGCRGRRGSRRPAASVRLDGHQLSHDTRATPMCLK
jgi:hypothetical protein